MRDLLYRDKDYVFSYRVAGVAVREGRVLVQKPLDDDGYSIPGGHVSLGETNAQTLQREFAEELHARVSVGRLLAVGEVFFPWGKRPCHQICLYYEVTLDDPGELPEEGAFHGWDDLGNERVNLDFLWMPIERLAQVQLYPPQLAQYLLQGRSDVMHFVYRELPEDTIWSSD